MLRAYMSLDADSCVMLLILDPYYNVPLEKVKTVLTDKKNYIQQLCSWNPDFLVSSIYYCFCYCASSYANAVLAVIILSICPSLCVFVTCVLYALWQNETMYCRYFDTIWKGNYPSFLTPTVVGGQHPFHLKFALKVTHPVWKMPISTDFSS